MDAACDSLSVVPNVQGRPQLDAADTIPIVVGPAQTENFSCGENRTQPYVRWIAMWMRLRLENRHGESCSGRGTGRTGSCKPYEKERRGQGDNIFNKSGLRRD